MKIDKLIENLTKIRGEMGDVEVSYIDMRFGNAPKVWDYTQRVCGNGDGKCYIEILEEPDPKYENAT